MHPVEHEQVAAGALGVSTHLTIGILMYDVYCVRSQFVLMTHMKSSVMRWMSRMYSDSCRSSRSNFSIQVICVHFSLVSRSSYFS
jgi:hypothetical protein